VRSDCISEAITDLESFERSAKRVCNVEARERERALYMLRSRCFEVSVVGELILDLNSQ
jgi:hypothetical protein